MYLLQILQIRNDPEHLKPTLFLPADILLCAQGFGSVFTSHSTSHSWFQNSVAHPCHLTHLFPQIFCKVEAVTVTGEAEPTGGETHPRQSTGHCHHTMLPQYILASPQREEERAIPT